MNSASLQQAGPRGWRGAFLPASLILNLFLAALIAGHLWQRHQEEKMFGSPYLARALSNAESKLSGPDAGAFNSVLRRDAPRYSGAARNLADARLAFEQQIAADPYDPAATRLALKAWQADWTEFFNQFDGTLVDALGAVSPEGRHRLIAARRPGLGGGPMGDPARPAKPDD